MKTNKAIHLTHYDIAMHCSILNTAECSGSFVQNVWWYGYSCKWDHQCLLRPPDCSGPSVHVLVAANSLLPMSEVVAVILSSFLFCRHIHCSILRECSVLDSLKKAPQKVAIMRVGTCRRRTVYLLYARSNCEIVFHALDNDLVKKPN